MSFGAIIELICPILCFAFCVVHTILQCVHAKKMNKKITALCEKCGLPVIEDEEHLCPELTQEQVDALFDFVRSLHGRG